MNRREWWCGAGVALIVAGAGGGLAAGCGSRGATFPEFKAGAMPAEQTWAGVYYNPVYGNLHLTAQDTNIVGRWKRTDSSHWGELSGTVEGNLLRFKWTEHTYGTVGPAADLHGNGVFLFKMGQNDIPELDGEYALEDSDKTADWHCIKQVNVKPDLNSINGESPTGAPSGDQWQ